MPVTAKLSRRFYDQFGDEIVDELVELLNQVDLTYRSELREQNEMNFARFDAKLDQRVAELRTELGAQRIEILARLNDVMAKLSETDTKLSQVASKAELADAKADLIKWTFLFWAGTALAGLLLR